MTGPGAPSIEMRPAVHQDLDALLEIDTRCFPPGIAYPRDEIAFLLHAPAVLTLVAERSQKIAGFICLRFHRQLLLSGPKRRPSNSQARGELITIDVLPEFRRVRVGWQLYHAVEHQFRMRGGKSIELHVAVDNAASIAFYQRLDYRIISRASNYYLGSVDAWCMEKTLSDETKPWVNDVRS